jgi:hypothetical protein
MTDRPIIFSAPMIRALLAGRKTQTRRILKPQPYSSESVVSVDPDQCCWMSCEPSPITGGVRQMDPWRPLPYTPGDRLYVREAAHIDGTFVNYRADHSGDPTGLGWRPSIHMPRWASRLTLIVTDVRVQRLNDIIRGDAMAEGCPFANMADGPDPRDWYADLWNSLHGAGAWDANPWVVAISFTVQRGNIDQIGGAA